MRLAERQLPLTAVAILAVLTSVSCTIDLEVGSDLAVLCGGAADCPDGYVCVDELGRCALAATPCVQLVSGTYRPVPVGTRCEADGIPSGSGVCSDGVCTQGSCGDGIRDLLTEACDDGANNSDSAADACRIDCVLPSCGDGTTDDGEECDDGNTSDADACLGSCIRNVCGDAILNPDAEDCDDGNAATTDDCLPGCIDNQCGDGALWVGVETCEDLNSDPNDGCADCDLTDWATDTYFGFGVGGGDPALFSPSAGADIAVDLYGNVYVCDSSRGIVWRVEAASNRVRPYVGRAGGVTTTLPGPANWVGLSGPSGIVIDALNNLYIADRFGRRILKVDFRTQQASVVAGGTGCYSGTCGDGGPAILAGMYEAIDVAADRYGSLYVADRGLDRVRKVDVDSGLITSLFTLDSLSSIAVADNGDVFVAQDLGFGTPSHSVWRFRAGSLVRVAGAGPACSSPTSACGDGGAATAAQLNYPGHIAVSADATTLYIPDRLDDRLRRATVGGSITTIAGTGGSCVGTGCDPGGPASLSALSAPQAVVITSSGDLLLLDTPGGTLYTIDIASPTPSLTRTFGDASAFAFGGTAASGSSLVESRFVAVGGDGTSYVSNYAGLVYRVDPDGILYLLTGFSLPCSDSAQPCGDGGLASATLVLTPAGIGANAAGDVFLFDAFTQRVRKIDRVTGIISSVAGNSTTCSTIPYDCGDGGPASGASFVNPVDVAAGPNGEVYVADQGAYRVRRVDAAGTITTVIGNGSACATVGCGDGGAAGSASLLGPRDLDVDSTGDLYILDGDPGRIRRVNAASGTVETLVADGTYYRRGLALRGAPAQTVLTSADETIWEISLSDRTVTALAGGSGCTAGYDGEAILGHCVGLVHDIAVGPNGYVFTDHDDGSSTVDDLGVRRAHVRLVDPSGTGLAPVAAFVRPRQVTTGNGLPWFIADGTTVRSLDPAYSRLRSVVGYAGGRTTDGTAGRFFGAFSDVRGVAVNDAVVPAELYVSDAGAHVIYSVSLVDPADPESWTVYRFAGQVGVPGQTDGARLSALFDEPSGLAWDGPTSTLYVADRNNHVIRSISGDSVDTVAGAVDDPRLDADLGEGIALASARFDSPEGVLADADGNLLVADTGHNRVRRIEWSTQMVMPVLGDGSPTASGDGAEARWVSIARPRGLALDSFGNLFVTAEVTVVEVVAGDGRATGWDPTLTIYGTPPRLALPESATFCLSGIGLGPGEDELFLVDACSGFGLHLQRQAR